MELTRGKRYLLSCLSGLLLVLAFPHTGSLFPLSFVALVPFLLVEHSIYKKKLRPGKVFVQAYVTFLIYNVGAVYWIWYSTEGGAISAFLANALLMATVFYLIHLTKRSLGEKSGYFALFLFWIGFEYLHTFWELSWTWLTLGNVFAIRPEIIQWYSITGVSGGSLWILGANFVLFRIIYAKWMEKKPWESQRKRLFLFFAIVFVPAIVSVIMYATYEEKGTQKAEIVVVQPNIDPYNMKFSGDVMDQVRIFADLTDSLVTPKTAFILGPETALPLDFDEARVKNVIYYNYLVQRKQNWPNASVLIGASTLKHYDYKRSVASYWDAVARDYVEYYNTAMLINHENEPFFLHKSKLVLGVEKIPFVGIFPFLQKLAIENGGTSATLGTEDHPKIFDADGVKVAPVICYESIYGEYVSEQCRQGADFIGVITNDGWWKDSPGYKQHLEMSRLRAIENRKWVARSANTGTSAFINQRGDIIQKTNWWVESGLRQTITYNPTPTFFDLFGDLIGKTCLLVAGLELLFAVYFRFRKKKK